MLPDPKEIIICTYILFQNGTKCKQNSVTYIHITVLFKKETEK